MKAVVYAGPRRVEVAEVPDPILEEPTDVIIKLSSSGICGSDLHMYDGHTNAEPGTVLGHEPMGEVVEVGGAVKLIKAGDRVVIPFNVACGFCFNCIRGLTNACLTMNPEMAGAAYGYAQMGPYRGAQAEYLRVPHGDWACLKLPGKPGDHDEDDFVLLSDVFPTAMHATKMAMVEPGMTVAIFGAGPIGIMAAYCCRLKSAAEVYVVDHSATRLRKVVPQHAIGINYDKGDPVEQIKSMRMANPKLQACLRPGEEHLIGVNCGIDAVGYQAFGREVSKQQNPSQVIDDLARLLSSGGFLSIVGVYMSEDPAAEGPYREGRMELPWGTIWSKGLTIGQGQAPVKAYHVFLRDLIMAEKAKPSFVITKKVKLEDAPAAYAAFDERDDVIKTIINFV